MDLSDMLSSLSADDVKALQGIAASLMGGESKEDNTSAAAIQTGTPKSDVSQAPFDPKAISDIAGIMSNLGSSGDDPRCRLISALKPLLSSDRQQRADEAIRMIKLLELLPTVKESGILKGVFGQ